MGGITKAVLKRPVTTLLMVLCLVFFGAMSIFSSKLELTPEINMPMLVVTTVYAGAGPEDIDELITKPIENEVNTLSGIDTMTSQSADSYSMVLLQYEYGTDMDNAYSDLRKKLDLVKSSLPEDANEPNILEMDVNAMASVYMSVNNKGVDNVYNYVEKEVVPELEKLSAVASVDVSGGSKEYISIELIPERLSQYHLDLSTVAQLVGAASFTYPAGDTGVGNTNLNVSAGVEYKTPESLKRIPITTGNGNIIYLEDIAVVSQKQEDASAVGRYNGQDTVILGINRNQKYTAVDVSSQVKKAFTNLQASDPNLEYKVVNDNADQIISSLKSVVSTMLMAIVISVAILFIFFGDVKGSLIVATSIPISILAALIMMWAMGYSFNVITLSSIVLGVGMMVDNSIVVLEACFRAMGEEPRREFKNYVSAALRGTRTVGDSVLGSTLTTCVVFLPLGFLSGLSGQFFQPLGMTIVFCMVASLLSAVAIVPLCFVFYRPQENPQAGAYRGIRTMQNAYRNLMEKILRHKKMIMAGTVLMLVLAFMLAGQLKAVLMPETDEGTVSISITMKPDLTIEKQEETYRQIEAIITADSDLESYMLSSGGSGMSGMSGGGTASVTGYLKKDREKTTDETVELWKDRLQAVSNADISVEAYSTTSMMNAGSGFDLTIANADYDDLKEAADRITEALMDDPRVTRVSSSLANASPLIKVDIDPVAAAAEGLAPAQVAANLNLMLGGREADTMDVDGEELSVQVEYPKDEFKTLNQVENILIGTGTGGKVLLKDIADIRFEDSPKTLTRSDKQYQAEITADYTSLADASTKQSLYDSYVTPNLTNGVEEQVNAQMEMMNEEFTNLFMALVIAVFLVFVVMAAQFESPRFSFMVMTTIPFALIGSFFCLWLFDAPISMPSLIGFLMLIGTVVNNGILYVDTVDQYREKMSLKTALIEAGATRLRPILMTTLTTVVSMVPMAAGYGDSGELMQGLALVDVGGLCASTLMALLVLPVYYALMNRKTERRLKAVDVDSVTSVMDEGSRLED
ncbi:MAG: efflux RND transporter permease subunit [Eubacteriales bacterium]|nr:efflux RND transporter permease subunit [Eubacteriales bacterium]